MKRWTEDIIGIGDLDYFIFKGVPMRNSQWGPVVELSEKIMEELASRAIIEHRLPIRGKEIRFLRKSLGLTLAAFAEKLNLTPSSILKWERANEERLHPINEVAVRALVAEEMKIDVVGKYSVLRGKEMTPEKLELKAS